MSRTDRRFQRQFDMLSRMVPALRGPLTALRRDAWRPVRLPLAILFIAGGMLWFLPVLGIWMLPFGLLLLAVDLPLLRAPISAALIRSRRRINRWRSYWQSRSARKSKP
jgi:hypothetical protein